MEIVNGVSVFAGEINTSGDIQGHSPDILVSTDTTLTIDQCKGQVIYVTATATLTLPAVTDDGMLVTVYSTTAAAVMVNPDDADRIVLNGAAGGAGKLTSDSQAGSFIVLHNDDADGWRTLGRSGVWTMEA